MKTMAFEDIFRSLRVKDTLMTNDLSATGQIVSADLATSKMTVAGAFRRSPALYYLEEFFSQTPGLNADLANATEAPRVPRNKHFEILGTNGTSALATFSTTRAGLLITTAGADNDQMIVLPHLDTAQTAWANIKWGTENMTDWETAITTHSSIATTLIWAGLKLTNTPTIATDNDQVFFRYDTDVPDTTWQLVYSIGGTDVTFDTGVAVAASTTYRFRVKIEADRTANCYINDTLVKTTPALTNDVDLIPYIGVQALGIVAVALTIHYEKISRLLFEA